MTEHTILVVDADRETEEKIISTLEEKGHLVFVASGREISTKMGASVGPSLIYLKPAALSVEGFATCRAIHDSETLRNVPIIVLASVKGPLNSRYATFYGVVDYLKMPVDSGELIEKTEKILGIKSRELREPGGEDIGLIEEESALEEQTALMRAENALDSELTDMSEIAQPGEDYNYSDGEADFVEGFLKGGKGRGPGKSGLTFAVLAGIAAMAVIALGFLLYSLFLPPAEVRVPVAVGPPMAVQQQDSPVVPPAESEKQEQRPAEAAPAGTKDALQKVPGADSGARPVLKQVYSAQVGAFRSESSAEALVQTFKGKGYEAFTARGSAKNKETVYRVLIGKFENRKKAVELANQIQTKEKVKTIVFGEGVN